MLNPLSRNMLRWLAVATLLLAGPLATTAPAAPAAPAAKPARPHLVTAEWLRDNQARPDVLLLDASMPPVYAKQHIPGAANINVFTYGARAMDDAQAQALLRQWGVSPGRKVVLCDQGGSFMATRAFFMFHYYGFPEEDLYVLDGGTARWAALGLPVTTEAPPAPAPGTFTIGALHEETRSRVADVLTAAGDPEGHALIEALGADWHFGEIAPLGRPGHIPHGILLPSADFFNDDKTFKSDAEIARMMDYLGVRRDQEITSYCGGGIAASVPFFALRFLAGYPDVRLYVESEMGWLKDPRDLPFWTYDAPHLLRDADWLKAWGGPMLRMYGAVDVSIVDVRPAAAYAEGHLPFALNVTGETFAANLRRPGQLAALLGPAGVDPAHEAVVVSGAGLTPDAALALLALEGAGQSAVSVLTTPAAQWPAAGMLPVTTATVVGPRTSPKDQCVAPADYAAATPRDGVFIADPAATHGVYPKVFVAAGTAPLAQAPAGTVVHVPYASLLDADGAPLSAHELWGVLQKAGVPRYAELVCFAEAPGEAAVDCVVLKLMGYPDVKVWVR